jgi:TatA/E family protein of Tat protein translocase
VPQGSGPQQQGTANSLEIMPPHTGEQQTMGSLGPIHWIMVAIVVLLVFGGRIKLSAVMGDAAQGLRAFRDGLKD